MNEEHEKHPEISFDDETTDGEAEHVASLDSEDIEDQIEVVETPDSPVDKNDKKPVGKKRSAIYMAIFIIIAVIAGVAFWMWRQFMLGDWGVQPVSDSKPEVEIIAKELPNPELDKFINPTTGEKWLSSPKPLDKQGWMIAEKRETYQANYLEGFDEAKLLDYMKTTAPEYFEVGTRGSNRIVRVTDNYSGIGPSYVWFEVEPSGAVVAITRPQGGLKYPDYSPEQYARDITTDKVAGFDENIHYDSLTIPEKIVLKNGETIGRQDYYSIGLKTPSTEGQTKTLVSVLGQSKLYRVEKTYADTKLINISYELELPTGASSYMIYEPNPENLEGYVFNNGRAATWYDSYNQKTVTDKLHAIARGCGGAGAAVTRIDNLKLTDLVQVGKTPTGRAIYQPKDKTESLVVKAYDEYKMWVQNHNSLDEFLADHGLLLIENSNGELLVYVRDSMGPSGGCAKPVVYLYPTQKTTVDVRVGADVKISDPQYETYGWRGVVAEPNGRLSYRGDQYDSLFWEGYGIGEYPGIVSGLVVERSKAVDTMRRQLGEQGLNAKETSDFMEYWESKIPNKPYIRLTWLNTRQMDSLAPLYVYPKPDTVVRVFLDMEGFDKPIKLPSQKLRSVERRGFTVVEWGGLAPGGIL